MTVEELEIVQRRAIMLQDEKGRITDGKEQGEQEGESRLIMRQLKKRFGEIPEVISNTIGGLSVENLESLGKIL